MRMSISNSMKLAITETEDKLDSKDSVEDNLKKAMTLMLNHWLIIREEEQFRCAVGAVMLTHPEVRDDLTAEMQTLRALSSAIQGVPVDMLSVFEQTKGRKVYQLLPMWRKVKEG